MIACALYRTKITIKKKRESEMQDVMPIYNAQVEVNYTKEKEEVKRMGKKAMENENYSTSK